MPSPTVRGEYDELRTIASTFRTNADSINGTNQKLKSAMDTLQGGDWIGKGATAFYSEMSGQVMPSMQRLRNALSEAARVTQEMSQVIKQAETDSSSCFRL
jgi:WXG100 family type VII secretion target